MNIRFGVFMGIEVVSGVDMLYLVGVYIIKIFVIVVLLYPNIFLYECKPKIFGFFFKVVVLHTQLNIS